MSIGALKLISRDLADGTVHSNSTDEAVLASYVFPANFFVSGKVIKFECALEAPSTNGTDTLTIRVRFGPTTLTGTAVATSSAIDAANDDKCYISGTIIVRDADSSGTIIAAVMMNDPDAVGQATESYVAEVSSLDFTAAQRLEVTADWSVAHADNDVNSLFLLVYEAV
ncbi:MAG TPA: hypothetical protein VD931_09545 [Baekduia sp.]|nr:hypothetical protein [Baekduia sp.]